MRLYHLNSLNNFNKTIRIQDDSGDLCILPQDRQKNVQYEASTNNQASTLNRIIFHHSCIFNTENDDESGLIPPFDLHVPSYKSTVDNL